MISALAESVTWGDWDVFRSSGDGLIGLWINQPSHAPHNRDIDPPQQGTLTRILFALELHVTSHFADF